MKTTLIIAEGTMRAVKREAARRGQTMSELVEAALRGILDPSVRQTKLPPLPKFSSGGHQVDVADREALYEIMGR
jgi:hypothetical protein